MRKWVHVALAVLLVIVAGVIGWQMLHPVEPVYQGKRLSSWLKAYRIQYGGSSFIAPADVRQKADEVVRQAGTNALPTLFRMLRAKDSSLKVKLIHLVKRQHIIKTESTLAIYLNGQADCAFKVLGAEAQSAVPELMEIANEDISSSSRCCAIRALGSIGPSANGAVPALLRWATNANERVRYAAISALGKIGTEPDRVVPVLIDATHDRSPTVRTSAVGALGLFGPNAKLAVPALVEFLSNAQTSMERWYAEKALRQIDPEAAAKAGVK